MNIYQIMNASRQRYRLWLALFLMLGTCRSYHVTPKRHVNPNPNRQQRYEIEEQVANRRHFLLSVASIGGTMLTTGTPAARAVDVVLPGEVKPQEPKNRRFGGLASKIRTVGNIMVSPRELCNLIRKSGLEPLSHLPISRMNSSEI